MSPRSSPPSIASRATGFTLIEVMVSLLILSVMALMAWQGVEGISKAREVADGGVKRTLRLQSVMTQWQADLGAVLDTQTVDPLLFDGAALRMTRRAPQASKRSVNSRILSVSRSARESR